MWVLKTGLIGIQIHEGAVLLLLRYISNDSIAQDDRPATPMRPLLPPADVVHVLKRLGCPHSEVAGSTVVLEEAHPGQSHGRCPGLDEVLAAKIVATCPGFHRMRNRGPITTR